MGGGRRVAPSSYLPPILRAHGSFGDMEKDYLFIGCDLADLGCNLLAELSESLALGLDITDDIY